MSSNILVTYASRTGSTAGVADAIAEVLRDRGATVEVRPIQDVADPEPYTAVVVGSAIQDKQWLPEAVQFAQQHQRQLALMPTAMFTLCMTLAMRNGEKFRPEVAGWTAPVRTLLAPVSEAHFAGALYVDKVEPWQARLGFRLSVLFRVWSEGDHRDWQAIQAWAAQLYPLLVPETA